MFERHPGAGENAALNFSGQAPDCAPIETLEAEWTAACAALPECKHQEGPVSVVGGRHLTYGQQQRTISIIREHVRPGHRHPLAIGLSGVLANAGISKEQTQDIFYEVFDDDPEIDDRLRCVADTYDQLHAGRNVAGFSILVDHLPRHATLELQQVLPRPLSIRVIRRGPESSDDRNQRAMR